MTEKILIPNRFESILTNDVFKNFTPLLLPVEEDLAKFIRLNNKIKIQNGGILSFILGNSGVGKTTSIYSATVFNSEFFNPVISIPSDIEFRLVFNWINKELPTKNGKSIIVLFDGREITDDTVGLNQFLVELNQLLRKRSDLIFCWPTTDNEWHKQVKELAKKIGGSNFVPIDSDISIIGLNKSQWQIAFERLLSQIDLTFDDISLDIGTIEDAINKNISIGDFLGSIRDLIAERIIITQSSKNLPEIVFVISSGEIVSGEANRIRRAKTNILKPDELVNYSSKSEAGKFWKERSKSPEQHLGYIISLFNAKLTTVSSSAVAYSCLHFGEKYLEEIPIKNGLQKHITNARTTLKASDFYKFLDKQTTNELTSSKKGKVSDVTTKSYSEIQKLSSKHHRDINKAIIGLLKDTIIGYNHDNEKFEVDAGESNLFTDVVIDVNGEMKHLEFHHISIEHCAASKMSSYIMDKLRSYAIHYNLIPR